MREAARLSERILDENKLLPFAKVRTGDRLTAIRTRHSMGVRQLNSETSGGRRRLVRRPGGILLGEAQLTRSQVTVRLLYVRRPKAPKALELYSRPAFGVEADLKHAGFASKARKLGLSSRAEL